MQCISKNGDPSPDTHRLKTYPDTPKIDPLFIVYSIMFGMIG
jgi:hypothetical protein